MLLRIDEIGSIFDDDILKSKSKRRRTVADYQEMISKGLSFDPSRITEVTTIEDSGYYAPYLQADDGGFYPHPANYWVGQGKDPQTYGNTVDFYNRAGIQHDTMDALNRLKEQSGQFSFKRAYEHKSGNKTLIGTIHEHKGEKYKKVGSDNWKPVGEGGKGLSSEKDATRVGHHILEFESQRKTIQNHIEKKKGVEKETRKIAEETVKEHLKKHKLLLDKKTKPITKKKKEIKKSEGEGSKGGTIVGHTASGKPVYMSANHPDHSDFTVGDHLKASKIHSDKVEEIFDKTSKMKDISHKAIGQRQGLYLQAHHHLKQSQLHRDLSYKVIPPKGGRKKKVDKSIRFYFRRIEKSENKRNKEEYERYNKWAEEQYEKNK